MNRGKGWLAAKIAGAAAAVWVLWWLAQWAPAGTWIPQP